MQTPQPKPLGPTVHLQIIDTVSGRCKIDLRLPVNLAAVALRSGAQLLPTPADLAALATALQRRQPWHIEVAHATNHERILIDVRYPY